ncbi:DUF397 domain-containing protein [Streptomyces sp. NPDC016845]|uniref:DUF397 domain-containing protein n=1 Tax=Streptomyces sp. NPDC016845 TaxID=3364972 RepID=UPI0037BB7495
MTSSSKSGMSCSGQEIEVRTMLAPELGRVMWRKSTYSGGGSGGGDCVEIAELSEDIAIRDSKDSNGNALRFGPESWAGFVTGLVNLPQP